MNPSRALDARAQGQSLWYDNISRGLLDSGELARLIETGIVTGITTNPTIFQKAVEGSDSYDASIRATATDAALELYHQLTIEDVRRAADLLSGVYEQTSGLDGYVSLEVAPSLANEVEGTVAEGRRLFEELARPNVMIKVPGTQAGAEAFARLTEAGVNVNVTLLFSIHQYRATAEAYVRALRARHDRGEPVSGIASVASFFVSRVDSKVDAALQALVSGSDSERVEQARALMGKAGIANCKLSYRAFQEYFGADFDDLRAAGARPQRMLWASTSTKNPDYPDVLYVDALMGPDTVNTLPPATLVGFLDHGVADRATVTEGLAEAEAQLAALSQLGIDLDVVCTELEQEGVASFAKSFDQLIEALGKKILVAGAG